MSAMLARVSDPGTYQAFQHFITHAPWAPERIWRRLRAVLIQREGVLILDSTSFPKQGTHSVGVARQYCGTLGKVANCQVAVTAALWNGVRAWLLGAALYLPDTWLTADARQRAHIPASIHFQAKWRLALTLLRQIRASGFRLMAVVGDAEFGDNATLRRTLHRWRVPYAMGISSTVSVFRGTPRVEAPPPRLGKGRPRTRRVLAPDVAAVSVAALMAAQPARAWRVVSWRNGSNPPWRARFTALRVTPAHDWRKRRLAPEVWLLGERGLGTTPRIKYYLVALPPTASLKALVRLAHQRWAIEQQYQELKDELGLDHFEGRTFLGWHRHVALTALAYAWLQHERQRAGARAPTLPVVRAIFQEILTAHFFITRPRYLELMLKLKEVELRI
jgi:SRSO17 transposase